MTGADCAGHTTPEAGGCRHQPPLRTGTSPHSRRLGGGQSSAGEGVNRISDPGPPRCADAEWVHSALQVSLARRFWVRLTGEERRPTALRSLGTARTLSRHSRPLVRNRKHRGSMEVVYKAQILLCVVGGASGLTADC